MYCNVAAEQDLSVLAVLTESELVLLNMSTQPQEIKNASGTMLWYVVESNDDIQFSNIAITQLSSPLPGPSYYTTSHLPATLWCVLSRVSCKYPSTSKI